VRERRVEIDEALAAVQPPTRGKCKLQKWIDSLDPQHPRYDELIVALLETDPDTPGYRTQEQAVEILRHLKFNITYMTIGRHRASPQRCVCGRR
jgi:hypothetical protein